MPLTVRELTDAEASELANTGRYETYRKMSEVREVIAYYNPKMSKAI